MYLVDGNIGNASASSLPAGQLEGVKGTIPGARPPTTSRRLLDGRPGPDGLQLRAEAYDAVIMLRAGRRGGQAATRRTAIAAELTTSPAAARSAPPSPTASSCSKAGKDIDYDGVSGPVEFADAGDPTEAHASASTQYGADNKYTSDVEYQIAGKILTAQPLSADRTAAGPAAVRRPGPRSSAPCTRAGPGRGRVPAGGVRRRSGLGEGAEVELDDLRVVHQVPAGAGVGVAALVEHVAAVGRSAGSGGRSARPSRPRRRRG